PVLQLKLGLSCVTDEQLAMLTPLRAEVYEAAGLPVPPNLPFVGRNAFSHKGGTHIDAVLKDPRTFEHPSLGAVRNQRRILITKQVGRAGIAEFARDHGLRVEKDSPEAQRLRDRLMARLGEGYTYEDAEASLLLLMERELGTHRPYFVLSQARFLVERR